MRVGADEVHAAVTNIITIEHAMARRRNATRIESGDRLVFLSIAKPPFLFCLGSTRLDLLRDLLSILSYLGTLFMQR